MTVLFLIIGCIAILLATAISFPAWNILPVKFVQFPFRFLSVVIPCIAFLVASNASILKGWYKNIFIIVSVSLLFLSSYTYIKDVKYSYHSEGYYTTNDATTTVKDEYMPVWVKEKPIKRPDKKIEIFKGNGDIKGSIITNKKLSFNLTLTTDSIIQINTIYWPGWRAFIDGKEAKILYNNRKGLINFPAPAGDHLVQVKFEETSLRIFSDFISLISFVILIFLIYKNKHEKI